MLVGLFVRHYKSYKATHFMPITRSRKNRAIYIGINGVGKSAILDALDKYFNGGVWSINASARADGGLGGDDKVPFIAPVFLIQKTKITNPHARKQAGRLHSAIVDFINEDLSNLSSQSLQEFRRFAVDMLKEAGDDYFLIVIGRNHADQGRIFLGPFERQQAIRHALKLEDQDHATEALKKIEEFIAQSYSYFYIPVEIDTATYTKLEQRQIQKLLDDDILSAVSKAIGNLTVSQINENLRNYLEEIHGHIDSYRYKGTYRDQITIKDLTEKVFDAFFSTKVLHKTSSGSSIPVSNLSSGEKRQALIETIYSLLKRRSDRKSQLIIAIDEPDASLHASACHDQFERVSSFSNLTNPNAQVLLTTHWYGFLPLARDGEAHSITNEQGKLSISTVDLLSFRESVRELKITSRGEIPADVSMKSYNDLVQSIFSAVMRDDPYNWIICEGLSDKLYIENFLGSLIDEKKIRVLPVGGYVEVSRIHDRLAVPMDEPEFRGKIRGNVICLVDTDREAPSFKCSTARNLHFKRMVYDVKSRDVVLVPAESNIRSPETAIEASLDPAIYCSVLKEISQSESSRRVAAAIIVSGSEINKNAKISYDALDLKKSQQQQLDFIFETGADKVDFAKKYCAISDASSRPAWADELIAIFK